MSRRVVYVGLASTVVVILLAIAVGVFTRTSETPLPPGGISRDQAIRMASHQGMVQSTTPTEVNWAKAGPLSQFGRDPYSSANRLVWAVDLSGTFPRPSCGPYNPNGPTRCPLPAHHATVILDYFSGAFITGSLY
jgi:hypothetical protein